MIATCSGPQMVLHQEEIVVKEIKHTPVSPPMLHIHHQQLLEYMCYLFQVLEQLEEGIVVDYGTIDYLRTRSHDMLQASFRFQQSYPHVPEKIEKGLDRLHDLTRHVYDAMDSLISW